VISGEQVYLPDLRSGQTQLTIQGSEYHHLVRVRRHAAGDEIWVVNGKGTAVKARIASLDDTHLELQVLEELKNRGELGSNLILAVANLKGDHLDLIVEKATELGVIRIIPLLTDHTVKKGLKRDRLERIAVAAMKQSRRSICPTIHDLTPFKKAMTLYPDAVHLFCHAADSSRPLTSLLATIQTDQSLVLWIGPEGDWSKDEIDLASDSDYTFTGLGPRRLRAETAAIHAIGLVSALLQDPL